MVDHEGDMLLPRKGGLESFGRGTVRKLMTNYFSMGICAQTGYQVEQFRTKNRFCNDVMYVREGVKVWCGCTRKVPKIKQVLEAVYEN